MVGARGLRVGGAARPPSPLRRKTPGKGLNVDDGELDDVSLGSGDEDEETCSPYCVVRAGVLAKKTFPHPGGGRDPSWNQKLVFPLRGGVASVRVEVARDLGGGSRRRRKGLRGCLWGLDRQLALCAVGSPGSLPPHKDGVGDGESLGDCAAFRVAPEAFLASAEVDLTKVLTKWVDCQQYLVRDAAGRPAGTLQLALVFIPTVREGWLDKRGALGWRKHWYQLLGDGRLMMWRHPHKRPRDFKGKVVLEDAEVAREATEYGAGPSERFEIAARGQRSTRVYRLRARNSQEATNWIADIEAIWRRGRVQLQAPGAQEQELLDRTLPRDLKVYV